MGSKLWGPFLIFFQFRYSGYETKAVRTSEQMGHVRLNKVGTFPFSRLDVCVILKCLRYPQLALCKEFRTMLLAITWAPTASLL